MTKEMDPGKTPLPPANPSQPDVAIKRESSTDTINLRPLTREEMVQMEHPALVSHAWRMQKAYIELESDSRFLTWELGEVQDSVTNFSRAAKLAHKLNGSDLETIAAISIMDLPLYFRCKFAALFIYNFDSMQFDLLSTNLNISEEGLENAGNPFLTKLFTIQEQPYIAEYSADGKRVELDCGEFFETAVTEKWFKRLGKTLVFPLRGKKFDNMEPLVLGGLILGDSQTGLNVKDAEFAALFGDLLSSSLYNAQLVQKLNDLIIIDPLTQLFNRRHLFSQLEAAMAQALRNGHELSIAMADIDHFKRFNDLYGHICGDEVLREVANIIKSSVRFGVDIPARYGGEEFVLVMPFTSLETAIDVADRIRKRIKSHSVIFEKRNLSATCSFGVAEFISGETAERFIERADISLYQAKKNGRNQVCASHVYENPA